MNKYRVTSKFSNPDALIETLDAESRSSNKNYLAAKAALDEKILAINGLRQIVDDLRGELEGRKFAYNIAIDQFKAAIGDIALRTSIKNMAHFAITSRCRPIDVEPPNGLAAIAPGDKVIIVGYCKSTSAENRDEYVHSELNMEIKEVRMVPGKDTRFSPPLPRETFPGAFASGAPTVGASKAKTDL